MNQGVPLECIGDMSNAMAIRHAAAYAAFKNEDDIVHAARTAMSTHCETTAQTDDPALISMARLWDVGKTEPIKVGKASQTEKLLQAGRDASRTVLTAFARKSSGFATVLSAPTAAVGSASNCSAASGTQRTFVACAYVPSPIGNRSGSAAERARACTHHLLRSRAQVPRNVYTTRATSGDGQYAAYAHVIVLINLVRATEWCRTGRGRWPVQRDRERARAGARVSLRRAMPLT